eukprot:CAMPEP_0203901596 /NCGR_PEP_ID=MMETSP0359-20131031/43749_1 /ASSEMBLY_ACC=CAM_ASM_000338 /TAXON_ID=268821 /ORGANISM="Scrippsiella Hangoei, Strain SHTV-5" /LENGTH=225 /DNA_ID=CAMNT_0050825287 /DNA_START=30 /DNA_END=704 /DNA_ORIENTATION=+
MEVDRAQADWAEIAEATPAPEKARAKSLFHRGSTRSTDTRNLSSIEFDDPIDDLDSDADDLLGDSQDAGKYQSARTLEGPECGGFWQPSMEKEGNIFDCFPDDECDNRGGFNDLIGATFEEDFLDDGPLSKATGAFEDSSDIASHFERLWSEVETGNADNLGKTLKLRSISYDALPMLGHAEGEGVLASTPPASPAGSCPISAEPMPHVRSSSCLPSAPGQRAPA